MLVRMYGKVEDVPAWDSETWVGSVYTSQAVGMFRALRTHHDLLSDVGTISQHHTLSPPSPPSTTQPRDRSLHFLLVREHWRRGNMLVSST
jgi:hypothetical protein